MMNIKTLALPRDAFRIGDSVRICGKCLKILTPKNTSDLGSLQPDCNDCTANGYWISVKDRLPENGKQILAYGVEPKNIHDDGLPYKTAIYDGKHWISDHFCESSYVEVTHWMLLPDPPK